MDEQRAVFRAELAAQRRILEAIAEEHDIAIEDLPEESGSRDAGTASGDSGAGTTAGADGADDSESAPEESEETGPEHPA